MTPAPQSLTQDNFGTALRYFLTCALSFAAGKGWISADAVTNSLLLFTAAIPMLYGMYVNYTKKKASEAQVTEAVRAGVSMTMDPTVETPPAASIGPLEAKSIVAAYTPAT